jgi:hypothetical protein
MLPYNQCSESQYRLRLRKGTRTVRIAIPTLQCILARDWDWRLGLAVKETPQIPGACARRDGPGTVQGQPNTT